MVGLDQAVQDALYKTQSGGAAGTPLQLGDECTSTDGDRSCQHRAARRRERRDRHPGFDLSSHLISEYEPSRLRLAGGRTIEQLNRGYTSDMAGAPTMPLVSLTNI